MVRKLAHFKKAKGYAAFCPAGQVSFEEMAELVPGRCFFAESKGLKNY
jgi:hypothetical protein